MKKIKTLKIITACLSVVLVLIIGVYAVFESYYSKLNYQEQTDISLNQDEIDEIDKQMQEDVEDSPENEKISAEEAILNNLKNSSTQLISDDNVFNILLIGTDERGNITGARSDSMIVVSINKKTKEITMTSFMRDCYVSIPGYKNNRLNAANAYGGPSLLIDTIEENFKISIDRYANVDFFSFIDIVDAVGGIDMEISEAERKCINQYTQEINRLEGIDLNTEELKESGNVHLTGKQALSYARIRYVGNSDFERTERQRKVINAIFDQVKTLGIIDLNSLFNKVLPLVTTDLTRGECISLLLDLSQYKTYTINSNRVPYDNTWSSVTINKMSVLSVDFDKNIQYLQRDIYHIEEK